MSFELSDRIFIYSMFFVTGMKLGWINAPNYFFVLGLTILFYPLYRGFKLIIIWMENYEKEKDYNKKEVERI